MDADTGRLNTRMRDLVEVLHELDVTSRRVAADNLLRAGVPLRVIGRVLDAEVRRRPSA